MSKNLVVIFEVNEFKLSIPISSVKEIIRMVQIERIPRQPSFIEGVINFRGTHIPIIDLRKRFLIKQFKPWNQDSRIMVIHYNDKLLGLIVDQVDAVKSIILNTDIDEFIEQIYIKEHFVASVSEAESGVIVNIDVNELFNDIEEDLLEPLIN
jgi:purine-binding chemotaxis protein CheW